MKPLIIAICMLAASVGQAATVELLESTIVDNNALNFSSSKPPTTFNRNINGRTYQRFPMTTFKGYQYATYYDANRNVCLGRRKLPDGAWDVIRFTDYTIASSDSHNVVTVGICAKDGTIHLAFDHHAHDLNYRVSVLGAASTPEEVVWSTDLFSPITDQLGAVGKLTRLTYPSFFSAPNGNLMLYYRSGGSGNGDGMIQEYNGTTHDWTTGLGKFISKSGTYNGAISSNSTSRNPYINGISYGGTRLHASWGWRESSAGSSNNHDLNYAYSDDNGRTWRNNAGTQIGVTGSSYISINSPGLVAAPIAQGIGLSNQYTHYAFPDGSCHVMVVHGGKYQHYWRDTAGNWNNGTLSFSGSRPKMVGDDDGNLFLVYTSGSKPRIAKGVPNAAKTAWSWSSVYTQNVSEGGEGQIDYDRWEADRVLSIYGQEKPANNNETPSPLHVFDYRVSTKAILPVPANETEIPSDALMLEWTAGYGANMHRVYLGTNELAVSTATTSSPEYQGQQSGTSYIPSPTPSDYVDYYWRVDEVKADSTVVPGLTWQFTLAPPTGVVVQVVDQGQWDEVTTWDPNGVPIAGIDYETSMQLQTPSNSALFAGDSLTIFSGGELTLMNTGTDTVIVSNLVIHGGRVGVGAGNDVTSTLAGNISVVESAGLIGDWDAAGPHNLRVQSKISGAGLLISAGSDNASTHTLFVENPENNFSGRWFSVNGGIEFLNEGAVGSADIEVFAHGKLRILGNWSADASLTVADAATAEVDIGTYAWTVSNLVFGTTSVPENTYTAADLNALGVNAVFTGSGTIHVGAPLPPELIAGWDTWNSATAPSASVLMPNITGSASTTTGQLNWNTTDERGASNDGDWGTVTDPTASTNVVDGENLTLPNATTSGAITFTIMNNGPEDIGLGGFHFDAYAFRPKAPRTYELSVLAGGGISEGVVFTSADDAITSVGGAWNNGAHDDIDIDLTGLSDNTLGAGESVQFLLAFSGGAGDAAGGHHLFVDNVGISRMVAAPPVVPPVLGYEMSGGDLVFNWTGSGFKVQSRTNLVEGIWLDVPAGDTPPVTIMPSASEEFFRLIEQ